jgi:hypothetical protein
MAVITARVSICAVVTESGLSACFIEFSVMLRLAVEVADMHRIIALCVVVLLGHPCAAQDAIRKNWFNDPFFQVSNGVGRCVTPLGPMLTEAEMKSESHSRVERGTSCWMAGTCSQPNAYLYDAAIGAMLRERFNAGDVHDAYRDTSLWITVKRRFVWVEGCVANAAQAGRLEALIRSVPDVERVIVNVMQETTGSPPYPVAEPGNTR